MRAVTRAAGAVALGVVLGAGDARARPLKVGFLIPISDGVSGQTSCSADQMFHAGYCQWYGTAEAPAGELALATTGLLAVEHFNARNGKYVKELGALGGCSVQMTTTVEDDGSDASLSVRNLFKMIDTDIPDVVIGTDTSSSSRATAVVSGVFGIPQLSYWATSSTLDNKADYPLFMRSIPTDDALAFSVCKYWVSKGYKFASVVYVNDNFGEAWQAAVVKQCAKMGMKQVLTMPFSDGTLEEVDEQMKTLAASIKATGINVVLLVIVDLGLSSYFKAAFELGMTGSGTSLMVSGGTSSDYANLEPKHLPHLTGTLYAASTGGVATNPVFKAFMDDWPTVNRTAVNARMPAHWQLPVSFFQNVPADKMEITDAGVFAYDNVIFAGLFACANFPDGNFPADFGQRLFDARQQVNFTGLSGHVVFDEVGNRAPETANYVLSNLVAQYNAADNSSSFSLVPAGVYNTTSEAWVLVADGELLNGNSRAPIMSMTLPLHDRRLPGSVKTACYVLFAINMCVGASFIAWAVINRSHVVVRASQTKFLIIIALGCMLSSSAIIPITIDDTGLSEALYDWNNKVALNGTAQDIAANLGCRLSVWLYCTGFVLTYSSLGAKIWRVRVIFNNAKLKKVNISNNLLFGMIAAALLVDWTLISVWTAQVGDDKLAFRRTVLSRDRFDNPLSSAGACYSSVSTTFILLLAAFHLSLLLSGSIVAYQARNVSTSFNEGKYVAVAMASNLQVLALAIPVLVIAGDNPASSTFLRSGVIFLSDLTCMCVIFLPKIIAFKTGASSGESSRGSSAGTVVPTLVATHVGTVKPDE
jgi:ABC-type branched-subunit amino acid transport system substrate-binding protein